MSKYTRRHQKFNYLPIWYLSVSHICLNIFHVSDTYRMIALIINSSGDSTSYSDCHSTLLFLVRFHYTPDYTSFFHGTNNILLITYPTSCIPSHTLPIKNHTYFLVLGLCAAKKSTKFDNIFKTLLSHIFISFPISIHVLTNKPQRSILKYTV